jgi:hypothetical protein
LATPSLRGTKAGTPSLQHSPISMLKTLFDRYVILERQIQSIIIHVSGDFCAKCSSPCCKECFCKESIESPFLATLIKKQKIAYHAKKGWMSPSGCRLDYGRPIVCYDFFCDAIGNNQSFQTADIQKIVREFITIGNKAFGNIHLICVDNLETLSLKKIDKMLQRINSLIKKIA